MLDLALGIIFNDGRTVTVTVPPAVQVAFERHYKVGIPSLENGLHLEHLYWLAFETLRKRGDATSDFDVWLDSVASLTAEEGDTDPTVPAA
jgi:hypothetical protein